MLSNITGSDELKWLYGLQDASLLQTHGFAQATLDGTQLALQPQFRNERFALLRLGEGAEGSKTKIQRMLELSHVEQVAHMLQGQPDSYVSQATFVGSSRQKSCFSRVRACWVDLDLHHHERALDVTTVQDIRRHCDSLGLPQPSLIISSGRGAYLKWMLTRAVTDLPSWDAAQSMLVLLFAGFAADKRARDACRVFRLLGTVNSKVADQERSKVKAVDGTGLEVDFETLAAALEHARHEIDLPDLLGGSDKKAARSKSRSINRWSERLLHAAQRGSVEELKLYANLREPILQTTRLSPTRLGWSRFCDLRDLYVARGGIPVGERNLAMLWMMNSLAHAGIVTPNNFEDEVNALLLAFPQGSESYEPLDDGSLQTLKRRLFKTYDVRQKIRNGEIDPATDWVNAAELLYRPSNRYLIEAFAITDEEQQGLRTIIDAKEKQRRADNKVPGRALRRQKRQELKERIRQWLKEHDGVCANISALARELGEAVARVWRALKACLKEIEGTQDTDESDRSASVRRSASAQHKRRRPSTQLDDAPSIEAQPNPAAIQSNASPSTVSMAWPVLAAVFASGFAGGKRLRRRLRRSSSRESGRGNDSHGRSLARTLQRSISRPVPVGAKHWMSAFAKDIESHYRRYGAWPTDDERREMMQTHLMRHQTLQAGADANGWRTDKAETPNASRVLLQSQTGGASRASAQQVAPNDSSKMTSKMTRKTEYLSSKDLFVRHYGEEGSLRWSKMSCVERLHALFEMEQDIARQARSLAQSEGGGIWSRWRKAADKNREIIQAAAQKERRDLKRRLDSALLCLRGAWYRQAQV